MIKRKKKGFTLVEMAIVIAVIAIVSAIVVPILVTVYKKSGKVKELGYVETSIIDYMGEFSHDRKMLSYIDGQYFRLQEDEKTSYYRWSNDELNEITDEEEIARLNENRSFEYQFGKDEKLKWSGGASGKNRQGIDWYPGFYKVILNYMDNGSADDENNTTEKLFVKQGAFLDISDRAKTFNEKSLSDGDYLSENASEQWVIIDKEKNKLLPFDYSLTVPDRDLTLYAVWRNDDENFKLTDGYGSEITGYDYDTFGSGLESLPDDKLSGYVAFETGKTYSFTEWEYYNETYGIKISATDVPAFKGYANITVVAKPKIDSWLNRIFVDFVDANGKTTGTTEYRYGDTLKLFDGAEKTFSVGTEEYKKYQYNFSFWTYNGEECFSGNEITLVGQDNEHITLTANYEVSARKYKVNFTVPSDIRYKKTTDKVFSSNVYYATEKDYFNHEITAPEITDATDVLGYTVICWNYCDKALKDTAVLLNDDFDLSEESILTGEINFEIEVAPNEYVIEFKDGGVAIDGTDSVSYKVSLPATALPESVKDGCIFDGWKLGKEYVTSTVVDRDFIADKLSSFKKIGETKDMAGVYSLTLTADFYKVAIDYKTSAIDSIDGSELPTTPFGSADVNKFTGVYNPERSVDFLFYIEDKSADGYFIKQNLAVMRNGEEYAEILADGFVSVDLDGVTYHAYKYTVSSDKLNVYDKDSYYVTADVTCRRNGKDHDVKIFGGVLTLDLTKANPVYDRFIDIEYYYSENVKDFNGFAKGYFWTNGDTVILGKDDVTYYNCVTFTPEDTANYNVMSNVGINVSVAKGTVVLKSCDGDTFFDYSENISNKESVRTFNFVDGDVDLSLTENDYEYVSSSEIRLHPIINAKYALPYVRTVDVYDASYNKQGKLVYNGQELVWFNTNDNVGQFHLSGASLWKGSDGNNLNKVFEMNKDCQTVTYYGFTYYQTKVSEYTTTNGNQLAVYKKDSTRFPRMILPLDGGNTYTEIFTTDTSGDISSKNSINFGIFGHSGDYDRTITSLIIPKSFSRTNTHSYLGNDINAFTYSYKLDNVIIEGNLNLDKYTFTNDARETKTISKLTLLSDGVSREYDSDNGGIGNCDTPLAKGNDNIENAWTKNENDVEKNPQYGYYYVIENEYNWKKVGYDYRSVYKKKQRYANKYTFNSLGDVTIYSPGNVWANYISKNEEYNKDQYSLKSVLNDSDGGKKMNNIDNRGENQNVEYKLYFNKYGYFTDVADFGNSFTSYVYKTFNGEALTKNGVNSKIITDGKYFN